MTRFRVVVAGAVAAMVAALAVATPINDALQGTYGTPSNTNRYVTDLDPRVQAIDGGVVVLVAVTAPITDTGTSTHPNIGLAASGASAGTYTNATVTVTAKGLLTSASSGTAPVTSVGATAPLTTTGGTTPTISTSIATSKLVGRTTAGVGIMEEIAVDSSLTLAAASLGRAALTGDATASAGSNALTLATVNLNTGTWGDASHVGALAVNGKGLVTAASSVAIAIDASAITSGTLGTANGGTGAAGANKATVFGNDTSSNATAPAFNGDAWLGTGYDGSTYSLTLGGFYGSSKLGGIRFKQSSNSGVVFYVPASPSLLSDVVFALPTADGSAGQPLKTDGSGALSFGTISVAGGGTGLATLTAHSLYVGNGTSAPNAVTNPASNISVLQSVSGADPQFTNTPSVSTLTAINTSPSITLGTSSSATGGVKFKTSGSTGSTTVTGGDPGTGVDIGVVLPTVGTTMPTAQATTSGMCLQATTLGVQSYAALNLGTAALVTGTLAVGKGGTGQASNWVAGGVPYGASTSALGTTGAGSTGQYLLSGGTGAATWGSTEHDYSVFNSNNALPATRRLGQTKVTNASTVTADSSVTPVVVGVGAGNWVLSLCSDSSTCGAGNVYLTCTTSCTATVGSSTVCTVTKASVPAGTTLTWSETTACTTTQPIANINAHFTTP